jgi:hypothetical protein
LVKTFFSYVVLDDLIGLELTMAIVLVVLTGLELTKASYLCYLVLDELPGLDEYSALVFTECWDLYRGGGLVRLLLLHCTTQENKFKIAFKGTVRPD